MLDYFVPSDFARRTTRNLMACRMGLPSATEYNDGFRKCKVICADVSESEAKFIFEMTLADWLSALVLPYNYADLMELCCVLNTSAQYSNITLHIQTYTTTKTNQKKIKRKDFGIRNGFHKTNNSISKIHQ